MKRKRITFYLNTNEDIENYLIFKTQIKRDKKYFNVSNFFKLKIEEYLKKKK